MQVEDNVYVQEYNSGIAELNSAFANLRTLEDYQDSSKYSQVEKALVTLDATLDKFSDQTDAQVISLRNSINGMRSTYEQNYATANDGAKPIYAGEIPDSKEEDKGEQESLSELIDSLNQLMRDASSAYNNMAPLEELTPYKDKIVVLLQKIESLDADMYASAKQNTEPWMSMYEKLSLEEESPTSSDSLSQEQRVQEFRNLFIANDYSFRNIDLIAFQDEQYRTDLEAKLQAMQTLLEPLRKSSESNVSRVVSDLENLEAIFEQAIKQSEEMASSVANIEEELAAIQDVFHPDTFTLSLEYDIMVDDFINTKEEVREWAEMIQHYQSLYPRMLEFLEKVRDNTIDGQSAEFLSYYSWLKRSVGDELEESMHSELSRWKHYVHIGVKPLEHDEKLLESELQDQERVKEYFEIYQLGKRSLENIEVVEEVMQGAVSDATQSERVKYDTFGEILQRATQESLQNQTLSEKFYERPELLEIAEKLMQESGREYGEISHLRVIQDISPRSRVDLVEDMQSGRKYFVKQSWEVFNIEFVEKYNEKYYIIFGSFRRNINVSDAFEKYGREWIINGINRVENSLEILEVNLPS